MTDTERPWSTPIVKLDDFRDRAVRIEQPLRDFPRTEGQLHAVLGGAGMGKTSLLNVLPEWLQLRKRTRRGQYLVPTLIDYDKSDLKSPQFFLLQVVKCLREGLRKLGLCTIAERNFEPYFADRPPAEGFREALNFLLEQARQASSAKGRPLRDVRLMGLIDNADEIACQTWAFDLFRDLRNLYAREELIRRYLDLVLAGENWLARYFRSGAPWADGGRLFLCPMTPEAISTWLKDVSEGQLIAPLAQAVAVESGGHPSLMSYFVYEIRRQAEDRGWGNLPPDMTERLVGHFIQQHQDILDGWVRSLWQADPPDVLWATYRLLAEAGDAGLETAIVEDKLWKNRGVLTDGKQALERLVWQGVVSPVPDKPQNFAAKGVFRRYCQQRPAGEPPPESPPPPTLVARRYVSAPMIEYDDFDLHMSAEGDHYRVRVKSHSAGEASDEFYNPISHDEQAAMWQSVTTQQERKRDVILPRPQLAGESRNIEAVGRDLFHAIFHGEVLARLRSAWENADREGLGLRIKLILEPPELHSLPWELLYDDKSPLEFLALSRQTPLVRYVEQPTPVPTFKQIEQLRLLFVVAAPENYPALNLDQEMENMRVALAPLKERRRLDYDIIRGRDANVSNLQQILLQKDYHVFHFLGHGAFDDALGQGVLLLEGIDGHGEPVSARQLARLLRDMPDIRLVFLNACETALATEMSPFASVAGALVKLDVPAVIASQYAISDKAAIRFAQMFYQALANFHPLETAVAEGRKAIDLSENNYEWGVPVLYLRAQNGRMFQ